MNTRQLLRGPRRINRRKALPKVLLRPIEPNKKTPCIARRPVAPCNIPPDPRRVGLQRRPVAPGLIQYITPHKDITIGPHTSSQLHPATLRVNVRRNIHRPAKLRSRQNIPTCPKQTARRQPAPSPPASRNQAIDGRSILTRRSHIQPVIKTLRNNRHHRDHATNRTRTIQIRRSAPQQLNILDSQRRNLAPVNPTSICIVQRHLIAHHQGSARSRRTQPPQCRSLSRRIRNPRTCSPKQLKSCDLPQPVIQRDSPEPRATAPPSSSAHCLQSRQAPTATAQPSPAPPRQPRPPAITTVSEF